MTLLMDNSGAPRITDHAADLVTVEVPWEEAGRWRQRFRDRGIPSTLVLDQRTRRAWLDLWTRSGVRRIEELLCQPEA
jgi:hypothetical protein